ETQSEVRRFDPGHACLEGGGRPPLDQEQSRGHALALAQRDLRARRGKVADRAVVHRHAVGAINDPPRKQSSFAPDLSNILNPRRQIGARWRGQDVAPCSAPTMHLAPLTARFKEPAKCTNAWLYGVASRACTSRNGSSGLIPPQRTSGHEF